MNPRPRFQTFGTRLVVVTCGLALLVGCSDQGQTAPLAEVAQTRDAQATSGPEGESSSSGAKPSASSATSDAPSDERADGQEPEAAEESTRSAPPGEAAETGPDSEAEGEPPGEFTPAIQTLDIPKADPESPEPAESVAATLCQLTREQFLQQRERAVGQDGLPAEGMRMESVALEDRLIEWESVAGHYPETIPAVQTANLVFEYWENALAALESGDRDSARGLIDNADDEIEKLPEEAESSVVGC